MRAGIYCRISNDPDESAAGVNRQAADCRDFVRREGWEVANVYTDNDVSASQPMEKRPQFMAMLADASDGALDAIVAWRDDRLWRNPDHQRAVFALCRDVGVKVVATPSAKYDPTSHDDQFVAGIRGLVAEYEAATTALRIKRALADRAAAGKPNPGRRPFGWESWRREEERPDEVAAIRDAVDRIIAGESARSVRQDWDAHGPAPAYADEWSNTAFMHMLRSPGLAGLREYQGEIIGKGTWSPIISPERRQRLLAALQRPSPGHSGRSLLSGLASCGACGQSMRSSGERYVCRDCFGVSIARDTADRLVGGAVVYRLSQSDLASALAAEEGEADTEEAALADLETRLDQLTHDYYVESLITRAEFQSARAALSERAEDLRQRLARRTGSSALDGIPAAELAEAWDAAGVEWQRSVLQAVVSGITIEPTANGSTGSTVDPDRIRVHWVDAGV